MKHAWLGIASILLFACGKQCPDETSSDGLVGNSVGCGNPVFAEMTVTEVNCVKCGAGIFPPTVFSIAFGKSLEVVLDSQNLVLADSVQSEVHLYHGMQVPVVSPLPLDSFAMEGYRLRLHSANLGPAIRTMGEEHAAIFPFSIRIRLRIFVQHLVFEQEGLLAGLGLVRNSGVFIATDNNPLQRTDRINAIGEPLVYFQGLIDGWDSLATGTKSAFVYVQGSPYHAEIDPANGRFCRRIAHGQLLRIAHGPGSLPGTRLRQDTLAYSEGRARLRPRIDGFSRKPERIQSSCPKSSADP